jgi:hypothetical protein
MKSFLIKLFVFSLITLGVLIGSSYVLPARWSYEHYWAVWLFFIGSTFVIHKVLSKVALKQPKEFVFYYLVVTGVKFLLYLIIIAVFSFVQKQDALGFATAFLLMYLFYSVFEVVTMVGFFKQSLPDTAVKE